MRIGQVVNENGNSVVYPTSAYQTDVIANISVNWLRNTWERGKKPCATLGLSLGCRGANLLGWALPYWPATSPQPLRSSCLRACRPCFCLLVGKQAGEAWELCFGSRDGALPCV